MFFFNLGITNFFSLSKYHIIDYNLHPFEAPLIGELPKRVIELIQ